VTNLKQKLVSLSCVIATVLLIVPIKVFGYTWAESIEILCWGAAIALCASIIVYGMKE
jgi:hypothetical protein